LPPQPAPVALPILASPISRPSRVVGPPVLPSQIDAKSEMRMKNAGYPGFRSLVQYQAYWLLKQRTHHILYVAGTGSGKTASVQLAVQSLGPECQILLLLPYKALYAEMEERMRKFGLSVAHYDSQDAFPSVQVVISTPGALFPTSHLLQGVKQRANSNRLLAIVIDEAVSDYFTVVSH
jgi:replicative superfamily II helicase